jgi:hypothetical protein
VAWVHGPHTTKFGFYLENYRKNEQFGTDTQGEIENGAGGSLTTKNSLADSFLGRIQNYTEGTEVFNGVAVGGYAKGHWQMTDLEPYINDDWKVTPHLTLNLGVRWYIYTRIHDVSNPTIDSGFEPNLYSAANEDPLTAAGLFAFPATGATPGNYGNGLVECGHNGVPNGCQLRNTAGNIGPRFGFAWDPTGHGTTSIRGGYGLYFESGNGNEAQTEGGEGNAPSAPGVGVNNVLGYNNIAPSGLLVPAPVGFTAIPYSEGWPNVQQYSLSIEHQFGANNIASIAYVGNQGRDLARELQLNELPIGITTRTQPALAGMSFGTNGADGSCNAAGVCNVQPILINEKVPTTLFENYLGYAGIGIKENTASSNYNSLQASFRHTFSKGLTIQAAYTWSHALDNSSSTYQSSSDNEISAQQLNRWYGSSDFNRTQVLQLNYIYQLPFFKNSTSGFVRSALGGWQITGITSFFTGQPVSFNCNPNGLQTGIGTQSTCDTPGHVAIDKGTYNDPTYGPTPTWFNPGTIAMPTMAELYANNEPCMFGCMGRAQLTGPGQNNWDLALEKNFELPWFSGEHSTMQFRLETFNTFNHPEWNGFTYGCSGATPLGGTCNDSNNIGNGEVNSTWPQRNVQLGLKFIF